MGSICTYLSSHIASFFSSGSARSIAVKKNIVGSLLLKCISILISLQVVPLTIDYVNPTRYGIWLTISSIIAWLSYFDLGFAHGFRNRFAEARAKGENGLAKEYVSTTYAVLFLLFFIVFLIAFVVNNFLDWGELLNIAPSYNKELQVVFGILACFFCLNIVASVFTTMLMADQKPALASLIQTGGQLLAFIAIYILTKTTMGSLVALAFVFSGIPCFLLILLSVVLFYTKKYKDIAPSIKSIRFSLTKNILGLGGQFFVITILALFIFQFINILISRIKGPEAVTQYNIAYKYFNVIGMVVVVVLTPFWSAFTNAYVQKDFVWMRNIVIKLERMWLLTIPVLIIMVSCADFLYKWWVGEKVQISLSLSISMAVYVWFQIGGNVYMYLINGTSKVRLQLMVYLIFAVVSIPVINICCIHYGIEGALIVPTIVFGLQALVGKLQITKIINKEAKGIWLK